MKRQPLLKARPWRTVLLVLVVAAADFLLSLINLGWGLDSGAVPGTAATGFEFIRYAGPPLLAPLAAVALIWRNRFPTSVAVVAAVLGALSFSGVAFLVALYLLARRQLSWWVAGVIALCIGAEALVGIAPLGWDGAVLGLLLLTAVAGWGAYRGQRARLLHSRLAALQERAERSEAQRIADTERSKLAERHRIAREMHDTLAHRMSLVAVQAAALQVDAPDAETAGAAKVIRETAHAALGELRDVLGVLHDDGTGGPDGRSAVTAPPGILEIAETVEQWKQAGVVIGYVADPDVAGAVPDTVGRAAYRVVQEGITNVARHAPEADATVTLELQEGGAPEASSVLRIMVSNGPGRAGEPAEGAGLGLIGLAERVQLLGGTLEHGSAGSGYSLLAVIPTGNHTGPAQ